MDAAFQIAVNIEADIPSALDALAEAVSCRNGNIAVERKIRALVGEELSEGETDEGFPLKPQRIVADIRKAMDDEDIVLADTGAVKLWMARLYPTYAPLTCIISNGLSTMGFALPGAIAAKLAYPDRKVLAVVGDGGFLMSSQEIETAVREKIPLVILVWVDGSYGLTKWKMDLQLGNHSNVDFGNPDFVKYAESFGAAGYLIEGADDLLPTLQKALTQDGVSLIACPVDYSENIKLTDRLDKLFVRL
jgi:acetolactate synthase-1/2/3 large subunit